MSMTVSQQVDNLKLLLANDCQSKRVADTSWGDKMWHACDNQGWKATAAKIGTFLLGLIVAPVGIALLVNHIYDHVGGGQKIEHQGFAPALNEYLNKQNELDALDEKADPSVRQQMMQQVEEARTKLAQTIVNLTKDINDPKIAKACLDAAYQIIAEKTEGASAANRILENIRKQVVDEFCNKLYHPIYIAIVNGNEKIIPALEHYNQDQLNKQSELLAERGIFISQDEAYTALMNSYSNIKLKSSANIENMRQQAVDEICSELYSPIRNASVNGDRNLVQTLHQNNRSKLHEQAEILTERGIFTSKVKAYIALMNTYEEFKKKTVTLF